jgi:hypothetical protein
MNNKEKIEALTLAFNNIQNLVSVSDNKANISLTLQTFLVGFILGSSIISGIFDKINVSKSYFAVNVFYILFILFIITSISGIIVCLLIYKARFPVEKKGNGQKGLLYFNEIKLFQSSKDYLNSIFELDEEIRLDELSVQVYNISHIVSNKMKYVNASIAFLFINLILSIFLTLVAIIFI